MNASKHLNELFASYTAAGGSMPADAFARTWTAWCDRYGIDASLPAYWGASFLAHAFGRTAADVVYLPTH